MSTCINHPERPARAKGLCQACYSKMRRDKVSVNVPVQAVQETSPEVKERIEILELRAEIATLQAKINEQRQVMLEQRQLNFEDTAEMRRVLKTAAQWLNWIWERNNDPADGGGIMLSDANKGILFRLVADAQRLGDD